MDGDFKTLWKDQKKRNWSFYCPQCRASRTIPFQPKPEPRHFVQIGLAAAFFTLVTWPWFTWKGIVSFVPFWLIFETFYRGLVRVAVACPHCGFDPFLYMHDAKRARVEIEAHWRKKFTEKGIPFPGEGPAAEKSATEPPDASL